MKTTIIESICSPLGSAWGDEENYPIEMRFGDIISLGNWANGGRGKKVGASADG